MRKYHFRCRSTTSSASSCRKHSEKTKEEEFLRQSEGHRRSSLDATLMPTEEQLLAPQNTSNRSLSLFRPIPKSRSCDQASLVHVSQLGRRSPRSKATEDILHAGSAFT
ncbi:hypothetical protein L596_004453 [Steinernema carpocapsae]|uniref:Uncharacterized protein n=1 Tax=Steinernema carpocapsae TaxID=34508 RepID=A0A4V6I857_STECR|nr:hypothetical protein L596_004453 [Steinernema carpocapsae]